VELLIVSPLTRSGGFVRIEDLDREHRALWLHVTELWALARSQDETAIRWILHPRYSGWVTGNRMPHDRDAAVHSVGPNTPRITSFELAPLGVTIFEGTVGVVHYSYVAEVETDQAARSPVSGRWTEIYLNRDGAWLMIAVSGGPDGQR
jgi:hypothetical protein